MSVFWILTEIAFERGWWIALGTVLPIAVVLALIDRYAYPICPFCTQNLHTHGRAACKPFSRRAVRIAWPLLVVGCVHCFLDGWAIALAPDIVTRASVALSCGVIVHKLPESVAIGVVAARLTSNRNRALAVVGLIQLSLLAGSLFSYFSPYRKIASLEMSRYLPAHACFSLVSSPWKMSGG